MPVDDDGERSHKVSLLIQSLCLGIPLASASLISDALFIAQNAPRLFRAMSDVAVLVPLMGASVFVSLGFVVLRGCRG